MASTTTNLIQYQKRVAQTHKTRVVRQWFGLYAFFWFHTEFWIKDKEQRRPYTFIMRDWIFPHMKLFILILIAWYACVIGWLCTAVLGGSLVSGIIALLVSTFSGWLSAHLVWGGKWIKGEQEWPPILEC